MNLQGNRFAQVGAMVAGMKWLWACVAVVGLSACGTTKVNLENQALIQVQQGAIIYEIDGRVVYSMLSQREQAVAPGEHEILVTRFGDIRADRGVYRLNVSAGLTYQIAKDRQSVRVVDSTGATIDELISSSDSDGRKIFETRDQQRARQAQREFVSPEERLARQAEQKRREAQLKAYMEQQAAIAEAERQRTLPLIRKIGAQICREWPYRMGHGQIPVIEVGYVEGITDDKVQIRISSAYFKNIPTSRPDGFQTSIIWDDPMNWYLCR